MKRHTSVLLILLLILAAAVVSLSGCKAWRTISTTATYSTAPDKSGSPVTTISTKTVEEYQGAKKN